MKERLTARVGRIISGGLNALVDSVEHAAPEMVMEQAIREIDGAIDEVRTELGRIVANKHIANTRLNEENSKLRDLGPKIELAVSEGRDDLAEAAISKQLDIEAQIPILEATISEDGVQEKKLEGYINALQARKREMRDELRQLRESLKAAKTTNATAPGAEAAPPAHVEKRIAQADSAFERALEKAADISLSTGRGDRKTEGQLAELEDLARKNRIKERLAAVKGSVEKK